MARANAPLYEPNGANAEPASSTSTGPTDIVSVTVPANTIATYISVETNPARLTTSGVSPGNNTGPGLVYPTGAAPVLITEAPAGGVIKFCSAVSGSSKASFRFVR